MVINRSEFTDPFEFDDGELTILVWLCMFQNGKTVVESKIFPETHFPDFYQKRR